MATRVSKGSWSTEEDERLFAAVEELGTKWATVAGRVGTRNSGRKQALRLGSRPVVDPILQNVLNGGTMH